MKRQLVILGDVPDYSGTHDPLIPFPEAERLAALPRRAGADVTLCWERAAHGVTPADVRAARAWLSLLPPSRGSAASPRYRQSYFRRPASLLPRRARSPVCQCPELDTEFVE